MFHHPDFPVMRVCFSDVGLFCVSACSDRAAGEHQRDADRLECSRGDLAPGGRCSDVPGQDPGD